MDKTLIFFLGFGVLILFWNIFLTLLLISIKNKNKAFFETGKDNIYDLLVTSINQSKKVSARAQKIESDLEKIGDIIRNSFQKMGMVRYNPFKDTGGNQSFSLALLDLDDNGFIITSIHGREVNRVYAKSVEKGKSAHNLSAEEEEALKIAVSKNNIKVN
jgi:hypothetical protein